MTQEVITKILAVEQLINEVLEEIDTEEDFKKFVEVLKNTVKDLEGLEGEESEDLD